MDTSLQQHVAFQRVRFLYRHATKAVPFNLVNGTILLVVFWNQADRSLLIGWFLGLLLITFMRLAHVLFELKRDRWQSHYQQLLRHFMVGSMLSGAVWGGGYIVLAHPTAESYHLLYLLVLGGMASGAFTSMASKTAVYLGYLLPMMMPAILFSFLDATAVGYAGGTMITLFMLMLIVTHRSSSQLLVEGIRLGIEKEALVAELSASNELLKQSNQQLEHAHEGLRKVSLTDDLTHLPNRRHFSQLYQQQWGGAKRANQPLACLMIDIDEFKNYNDHYGHQAGDQCLQQVAQLLNQCLQRPEDQVARYGGEEFVAVLPETSASGAALVAQRMVETLHKADWPHAKSHHGHVTISIGIACSQPVDGDNPDTLLKHADQALYLAKDRGRNRHELWQ